MMNNKYNVSGDICICDVKKCGRELEEKREHSIQ